MKSFHRWICEIGWTDLGTAFALTILGSELLRNGREVIGFYCVVLAFIVYIKAEREV